MLPHAAVFFQEYSDKRKTHTEKDHRINHRIHPICLSKLCANKSLAARVRPQAGHGNPVRQTLGQPALQPTCIKRKYPATANNAVRYWNKSFLIRAAIFFTNSFTE